MPYDPDRGDPAPASLLVRRVGPEAVGRGAGMLPARLEGRAAAGGLFVLADLVWEPSVDPLAVAVFSIDRPARRARLDGIAVASAYRRRGLGARLVAGAAMVLGADGIEVIDFESVPNVPIEAFLRRIGFQEGGGSRLLYWL